LVQAESALKEALALATSDENGILGAWALNSLAGVTATLHGDIQAAWDLTEEALRLTSDGEMDWYLANAYEMRGFLASYSDRYEEARRLFERAMDAYRSVGAHLNVLMSKSNLAHLERQFGHHQQALEWYRESILGFREIGQLGAVAHQLECFGFLAMAGDQNERALKLFAAADALREQVASPMSSDEQIYFDEQLKVVQQKLDAQQFDRIWTTGRALTMEEALELALEENTE
jgi:tetratricopeptide (TPR) repeat protein